MGIRYDISDADLRNPHKSAEGYYIVDAVVSRTGVFPYRRADGSIEHEARLLEDVADPQSLESLGGKPVVLLHPRKDGKAVELTPDNVAEYQVGTVGTDFTVANGHIRGQIIIHRRDAIDAIEKLGARQLSPGYAVKEDRTPGELDGRRYDLAQREIRYNYVAIVPAGRQGSEVAMRIDDGDGLQIPEQTPPPEGTPPRGNLMGAKVRIDSIEVEVADAAAATAITTSIEKRDAAISAHVDELAAKQAKIDELTGEVDGLKAAAKAAKTDAEIEAERIAWATERDAVKAAAGRLGVKLDDADAALSNADLRRKVVTSTKGGAALKEDASDEAVKGFMSGLLAGASGVSRIDEAFTPKTRTGSAGDKSHGMDRIKAASQARADAIENPNKASA